jgi:hypothetical protein
METQGNCIALVNQGSSHIAVVEVAGDDRQLSFCGVIDAYSRVSYLGFHILLKHIRYMRDSDCFFDPIPFYFHWLNYCHTKLQLWAQVANSHLASLCFWVLYAYEMIWKQTLNLI